MNIGRYWNSMSCKQNSLGGNNMTKRNRKTKSGLQSVKSITDPEFAGELKPVDKKAKKTRPK